MPIFKRINGKWQECQALVKEGGAWKEIGAVTAKANGKWADIAPPKPAGRTWTATDFNIDRAQLKFSIKENIRQYFLIGDSFDFTCPGRRPGAFASWVSTPVPGLNLTTNGSKYMVVGTISGGSELADVMTLRLLQSEGATSGFLQYFRTSSDKNIPIKPAP